MRPLKIFLFAVIYGMTLYACEEESSEKQSQNPTIPITKVKHIDGGFLLSKDILNQRLHSDHVELNVHFEGKGALGKLKDAKLKLDHRELIDFNDQRMFIDRGSFALVHKDGSEIIGRYRSKEKVKDHPLVLQVIINHGKGEFENAIGRITLELAPEGNGEYRTWIKGYVHIREADNLHEILLN